MAFDVRDLLTDAEDARDLIEAYSGSRPEPGSDALKTVRDLIDRSDASAEEVVSALFDFAQRFAKMCTEISNFFEHHGVHANASIHVIDQDIALHFSGFSAPWAVDRAQVWKTSAPERVSSVSTAILSLTERLRDDEFLFLDRPTLEKRLQLQADRKSRRALETVRRVERTELNEFCVDGDHAAIKSAYLSTDEILQQLSKLKVHTALRSAFEEVEEACKAILVRMDAAKIISGVDPSPSISTLSDELRLYGEQAKMLAAELAQLERAEEGLGDFLRSGLWKQRWRVYEVWLLTKVINACAAFGAKVELCSVKDGTWHLPYGRAVAPVARVHSPAGDLEVFYQYFVQSDAGADMPDILVRDATGGTLIVLDPKHGHSYSRHRVQEVLTRYHRSFGAGLTAIVNYFEVRTYLYDIARHGRYTWLLASSVAPGTGGNHRLDHLMADILIAAGYSTVNQAPRLTRREYWSPGGSGLLYWARTSREVDESRGPWSHTRERGAQPLSNISELGRLAVEGMDSSFDGINCAVRAGKSLLLISGASRRGGVASISFPQIVDALAWNHSGDRLVIKVGDDLLLLTSEGESLGSIPCPTQFWEPVITWIGRSDAILYAHQVGLTKAAVYRLDAFAKWSKVLEFPGSRARYLDLKVVRSHYATDEVLLQITKLDSYRVTPQSIAAVAGTADLLSVSPSGRFRIAHGPMSLRASDGINLLQVTDFAEKSTPPFVRYFGEISSEIKWSADERSFAFFANRRFRSGLDELRLLSATIGERDTATISLPGQGPAGFAWMRADILRQLSSGS